jgi:hypothetical protein
MSKLYTCLIALLAFLLGRPAIALEAAPAAGEEGARAAASLIHDVQKIVEVQRLGGWKIDRYECAKMMPDALMSVCRTTDEARGLALMDARREVTRLGGPLEDALKNGDEIDELKKLLSATRAAHLLGEAMQRTSSECPPWVTPRRDFKALQTGVDRFFLSAGAIGSGTAQYAAVHPDGTKGLRGAGGLGGRLLLGRGFGHHWSVRVGPEINVSALVARAGNPTAPPIQYQGAIPIVLRYTDVSWHYDAELAPLVTATKRDGPRYGGRFGVLIGISRLRTWSFIPWAGLGIAVELFPDTGGRTLLLNLKGGMRAGVDWDF